MAGLRHVISAVVLIVIVIALPALAQEDPKDDEYLIRGLLRDGLNEVAADKIFEFVFKFPGHPRSEKMLMDICTILISEGKKEKALPLLKCYLQEFPQGSNARKIKHMLAESLVESGNYPEAIAQLKVIINDSGYRNADRIEAKEMLARIYLTQKRFEVARILLEETGPKSSGPLSSLALAESHIGLLHHREAEDILKPLATRRRDDDIRKHARSLLSRLYLNSARYQECAELHSRWQPPQDNSYSEYDVFVALSLAVSNFHLGAFDKAYRFVLPLKSILGNDTDVSPYLPGVLVALQEWSSAATLINQSFTSTADTFNRIATGLVLIDTFVAAGMNEDALEVINTLVPLIKEGDEKSQLLLRASHLSTDINDKMKYRNEALSYAKTSKLKTEIHFLIARFYEESGLIDKSLEEYDSILDLSVSRYSSAQAHYAKGLLYEKTDQYERAVQEFEKSIELNSDAGFLSGVYKELINCFYYQRRWPGVTDAYRHFKRIDPAQSLPVGISWKVLAAAGLAGNDELALSIAQTTFLEIKETDSGKSSQLLLSMADISHKLHDETMQEELYKSLSHHESESIRIPASVALVNLYSKKESWELALETSQKIAATSGDPWFRQWARFKSAGFYGKSNRRQEQLSELRSIMSEDAGGPFFEASLRELQSLALELGNFSGALQTDPRFLSTSPTQLFETDRKLRQAQRFFNVKDFANALKIYDAYPNTNHLPPIHKYYYACALFDSGELNKSYGLLAIIGPGQLSIPCQWQRTWMMAVTEASNEDYSSALTKYRELLGNPVNEEMHFELLLSVAQAEEALDNWDAAANYYDSYIELARSRNVEATVLESVAKSYLEHNNVNKAISIFEYLELIAKDREISIQYRFRIVGLIEILNGSEVAAEEYLNIAYRNTDMGLWPARARLKAAAIYEKLKMYDTAERQYKFVAENYARTEEGVTAAHKLAALVRLRDQVEEEQLDNPIRN